MDEKLYKYIREQPEWVMEKIIGAIILNIPNNENDFCSGNILVCTCQQCEEDRQYEGKDCNKKYLMNLDSYSQRNLGLEPDEYQEY